MFDLESSIADWKQSLDVQESLSPDDIMELESHLRDCVSSLDGMGLSREEAFLIAQRRIGHPAELDTEFAKGTSTIRWVHRGKWMCIGILALIIFRCVGGFIFTIANVTGALTDADPMTVTVVYNIATISVSWLIVLSGLFIVLRHATLTQRIVDRIARIPMPILIGLPLMAFVSVCILILFNMSMSSGNGYVALKLSFYAYNVSTPILLLVAVYVLHRSERNSPNATALDGN